ncbi:protein RALF-like 19 [Momordica charantia]|uniref:Protein RALF-like 19 n=1 Tax=Momordica charantia TaxID=3673 RepID=A0A6J1CDH9_MOMCH|nr:protein RALF-like 19 [Momordica charantia]
MGVKFCLILLLLAAAVVPHSAGYIDDGIHGLGRFHNDDAVFSPIGDLFGETSPRNLIGRSMLKKGKYLSYAALKKNIIPCGGRGMSYYDCTKRKRANPYRRSCLAIHGCARFTD